MLVSILHLTGATTATLNLLFQRGRVVKVVALRFPDVCERWTVCTCAYLQAQTCIRGGA